MLILSIITLLAASPSCMGFAPMHHSTTDVVSSLPTSSIRSTHVMHATPVDMLDLASSLNTNIIGSSSMSADANAIGNTMASSSMILSETEAWVQPLSLVLGPFLNFFSFAMVSVCMMFVLYIISLAWLVLEYVTIYPFRFSHMNLYLTSTQLCRIVLSWYPNFNVNELPYSIVVWPTEPLLRLVRGTVPPAFGVDITPVVWLGIFSFVNEILLGQQGLLTMKMKYGI